MDVLAESTPTHYTCDGAEAAPSKWEELKARSPYDETWYAEVEAFLRWHADIMGSPSVQAFRREQYLACQSRTDTTTLIDGIDRLVRGSEEWRQKFVALMG